MLLSHPPEASFKSHKLPASTPSPPAPLGPAASFRAAAGAWTVGRVPSAPARGTRPLRAQGDWPGSGQQRSVCPACPQTGTSLTRAAPGSPSGTFAWKRHVRSKRGKSEEVSQTIPRAAMETRGREQVQVGAGPSTWAGQALSPGPPARCGDPTPPECRGGCRPGPGAGPLAPNLRAREGPAPQGQQRAWPGGPDSRQRPGVPVAVAPGPHNTCPHPEAAKTQGFQTPQGIHCPQGPAGQAGLLLPALLHEHVTGPGHVTGARHVTVFGHITGPGHVMGPRHRQAEPRGGGECLGRAYCCSGHMSVFFE